MCRHVPPFHFHSPFVIHHKKQALDLAVQLSFCMTDPQGFATKHCSTSLDEMTSLQTFVYVSMTSRTSYISYKSLPVQALGRQLSMLSALALFSFNCSYVAPICCSPKDSGTSMVTSNQEISRMDPEIAPLGLEQKRKICSMT